MNQRMKRDANTLPLVSPMMVRKFTRMDGLENIGGVMVMEAYDVENVGLVTSRNVWDEDVVDCSNRIFDITNRLILARLIAKCSVTVFPSRRFRNCRTGVETFNEQECQAVYEGKLPLLYLGNPVRIFFDPKAGITVARLPEFCIKSGIEMGS